MHAEELVLNMGRFHLIEAKKDNIQNSGCACLPATLTRYALRQGSQIESLQIDLSAKPDANPLVDAPSNSKVKLNQHMPKEGSI